MSWTLFRNRQKVFCAFCSSERKVNRKRSIGMIDVTMTLLASLVTMFLIFQQADARVFLIFVFFLAIAEFFIQIRWRLGVVCPHCGFDPVLYTSSHERAAQKVKLHLERRKNDPNNLLARPLNLPSRKATSAERSVSSPPPT